MQETLYASLLKTSIHWSTVKLMVCSGDVYVQEMADTVLQQLQSRIEFRSTDQLVTRAQLKAVAMELVETSSVLAVENELVSQGMLSFRTSSSGLQV